MTPLLNSLSSKLRLIVASGKTPTTSPALQVLQRRAVRRSAGRAVDVDVVQRPHQRAGHPMVEQLPLGHEPDQPPGRSGREAAEHEVDVADVVEGEHGPPERGMCSLPVVWKVSSGP